MIRKLLVVALALGAFFAWTSAAGAAIVAPVASCSDTIKTAGPWQVFGPGDGIGQDDRCVLGEGLQLLNYAATYGAVQGFWFSAAQEIHVESFSFDIEGGDTSTGLVYAAGGCDDCTPDVTIGPRSPASSTEHIVVDHPTDGKASIFATCPEPSGCATPGAPGIPPPPLIIKNLVVNVADIAPPTVSGSIEGMSGAPGGFLGWTNKSSLPVTLSAADYGFGVSAAQFDVGGYGNHAAVWDFSALCSASLPLIWPVVCTPPNGAYAIAQLGGRQDGVLDVSFSAQDIVGNTATTVTSQIGLDREAPDAPATSSVEFSETGWPGQRWTTNPAVTMHWAESPDYVDPPDLESPIKKNELQIHRTGTSNVQKVLLGPSELEQEHTLATDGRWDFSASYIDEATNHGVPATESIGLDRDAPKPPKLVDVGDWVTGSTAPGRRVTWQAPDPSSDLESGICGYVVRFDTSATAELHFGTDDATISKSFPIPAGLPEGTNYFHVSASSCAGVLSDAVDAELTVDTKPPAIELSGLLEPGLWSNSAQTASIDATDDNTGVESVGISLDGGVTTWTSGPNTTFVVPDGRHEVTAYARDEAGNQSSIKQWVRTDTHAPSVDIPTLSADDPALVAATVGDTASGLASAAIEMRRVDQSADSVERQWKALEGAEPITRGSTAPITIQRRIDDSLFAAGSYELRVAATDVAGNSTVEGDFALRSLQLPVRRAAELSAAVAEVRKVCRTAAGKACASASRCAKKLRCRTVSVVDRDHAKASVVGSWQDRYWLVGDALDAAGRPIANAQVVVSSTIGEGDAAPVGSATTDSLGRYGIAVPAGPTRVMTARIAGSNSQQPATATAKINVRADARFSPSARTVRSGRSINLAGRVLHPEFLPVGGVSVSVQWLSPNGWTAFVNPVSTDAQGKFSHIYRWAPRKQKYSVKLRALVQPVAGWPFASGSSDAVKIRVQPAG